MDRGRQLLSGPSCNCTPVPHIKLVRFSRRFQHVPTPIRPPHPHCTGLFYLTYGLFGVPSAAAGLALGMRWWYGGIIVAWGVVASCTAAVHTAPQLYAMRLLLGMFEAGAAPCAWHVLSAFYPYDRWERAGWAKPRSEV